MLNFGKKDKERRMEKLRKQEFAKAAERVGITPRGKFNTAMMEYFRPGKDNESQKMIGETAAIAYGMPKEEMLLSFAVMSMTFTSLCDFLYDNLDNPEELVHLLKEYNKMSVANKTAEKHLDFARKEAEEMK